MVSLALKHDLERHELVKLENADAIDPAIAALLGNCNLNETRGVENSLAELLEPDGWQLANRL